MISWGSRAFILQGGQLLPLYNTSMFVPPLRVPALLCLAAISPAFAAVDQVPQLTLEIQDFATLPMTGKANGTGQNTGLLARVNFMREEPGGTKNRIFVNDLNGPLYILDKQTRKFTTYLNFNGRDGQPGLFRRLPTQSGFANGFICFTFDPDYARNGRFYTIHLEDPESGGAAEPDISNFPGLTAAWETTPAIPTPGRTLREAVLLEWTDTNTSNTTFEGTARELMRVQLNGQSHPMGDLVFNPTARPGDPDWRVLYIACGDGSSGELKDPGMRSNPQRLDTVVGKILRIVPDLSQNQASTTLSQNGRYRIPKDNPFASKPGERAEIWAYGLRNPTRLTWDADPQNPRDNHLLASVIGLYTWETVVEIRKGANYGYSLREGNQKLEADNKVSDLPADDRIPVRINATETDGMVTPTYPLLQYGHVQGGGDAISSGYPYRGKALPQLAGKYVLGDISTGNVWWVNYGKMLSADVTKPQTTVELHPIKFRWTRPGGSAGEVYGSMYAITELAYHARGGTAKNLPGYAKVPAGGRSDIHFWADSEGELYITSKSDGMIRKVTGATAESSDK